MKNCIDCDGLISFVLWDGQTIELCCRKYTEHLDPSPEDLAEINADLNRACASIEAAFATKH